MRTSIASIGMAGMLALSLSLAACGGSTASSASSTSAADTSSTASTASTAEATSVDSTANATDTTSTASIADTTSASSAVGAPATFDHPGFWTGPSSAGGTVYYEEDAGNGIFGILVLPENEADAANAFYVIGGATKTDDGIAITDILDTTTNRVVNVSFLNASDSELSIRVEGVEATLSPISVDEYIAGEDAYMKMTGTSV